jgi:archaellum component FlaC
MESFFRRLEIYIEVPATTEMMDTITLIMVEVLSILGIATKEIKQGRMSEQFNTSISLLTLQCSEKYGKKLIGRTDMEDALKTLDKLTQEEARMAVAQNLKATHAVEERVKRVASMAVTIDNRVAGMDDRVAGVDDRVARVNDRIARVDGKVASVDDKVASVDDKVTGIDNKVKGIDTRVANVDDRVVVIDDKVAEVPHGEQVILSEACDLFNLNRPDGKEAKQVMRQTANDVDLAKRSSSPKHFVVETDGIR